MEKFTSSILVGISFANTFELLSPFLGVLATYNTEQKHGFTH